MLGSADDVTVFVYFEGLIPYSKTMYGVVRELHQCNANQQLIS